jgi:hypothetical protein
VRSERYSLVLAWGLAALVCAGCQEDEVRHYQVPKVDTSKRLLAAIFSQGERTWFFKLVGPPQAVAECKEEFDRFVGSVRFTDKAAQPVVWTVPDAWQKEPGSKLRYATFRIATKDAFLELSVVPLEGRAGSILANVNRWRDQIGLEPVAEADLGKLSKEIKVEGVAATLVDMTGPGVPLARKGPALDAEEATVAQRATEGAFQYTTPAGWEPFSPSGPIRPEVALQVRESGGSAEVTIMRAGGTLLDNVNRWRGQLKLGPVREEELRQDVREIQVAGLRAHYADLVGPESAGRQRILGVVLERGGQTWFFKMKGPADLVGRQKAAFEAFVGSVRFDGGGGANHE